jgi:hypothetical protein
MCILKRRIARNSTVFIQSSKFVVNVHKAFLFAGYIIKLFTCNLHVLVFRIA